MITRVASRPPVLGQVDPRLMPPPPRPINWTIVAGWVVMSATALGLFWGAAEGWGTGRTVRRNGRRRVSRNSRKAAKKPARPRFNELSVLTASADVREARPRGHHDLLPPGVAAKLKKLPPGIYKYGWGPKRGESITRFKNASLLGAITSTRIGAAKVGEFHWVIDNLDPSYPVVIRGIDEHGRTVFRVEDFAVHLQKVAVRRSRSTRA